MTTAQIGSARLSRPAANVRIHSVAASIGPAMWLFIRLALGVEWVRAAQEKLGAAGWTAAPRGTAVQGFLNGALGKASGAHPEVGSWFAALTRHIFLPQAELFASLVTYGELLVGIALIIGLLTRFAALGGVLMNFLFLAAGTSSTNPQMLVLGLAIVIAGTSAGTYGLDRWVLSWIHRTLGGTQRYLGVAALAVSVLVAGGLAFVTTDHRTWAIALGFAILCDIVVGLIGLRQQTPAQAATDARSQRAS